MLDYHALAPELILTVTVLAVLGLDLFLPDERRWLGAVLGITGLTVMVVPLLTLAAEDTTRELFGGSYVVDDFALVMKGFFIIVGYVVLLMSVNYVEGDRYNQGEFYFLILASILGAVVMSSSRDLITLFVGLELVSGPAYLLAGWRKADARSHEAALKYFIIGVLATAVLLYGMSMIYGATGAVTFDAIREASLDVGEEPVFILGVLFILVGFGFKVAAVPFHFWAPDTYQGAPTPVTAYIAVGSKVAGFVGMLLVTYLAFTEVTNVWGPAIWILSALSMIVGNLVALRQTNIVRLLAYSSVAQAGFMLAPFGVAGVGGTSLVDGFEATVTYMLIYGVMTLGAFAVVIAGSRKVGSANLEDWAGLGNSSPQVAALLSVFFFSLAGIPPLAGWFAKLVMFRAVIAGFENVWAVTLGVIAVIFTVVALFYYSRVVKTVWMDPASDEVLPKAHPAEPVAPGLAVALGLTAAVVIILGILPQLVAVFAEATTSFAGG